MTYSASINTLKYRAPTVVPLEPVSAGVYFAAVLMPGYDPDFRVLQVSEELHKVLCNYVEWNVLEPRATVQRAVAKTKDIEDLLNSIMESP